MPILRRRDLAASVLVAVLLATYLAFLATSNFLTTRGMTAITLILAGATIILLADAEQPAALGWLTAALALPAVVCAALAFALAASVLLLTISIATTLTLCSIHLVDHITFTAPDARNDDHSPAPRPVR